MSLNNRKLQSKESKGLIGFLPVIKPTNVTSMQVVEYVKGILGRRSKVGHTGTLDPLGSGLLVLAIGKATKFIQFLDTQKEYFIEVAFGIRTDTDDLDGRVLELLSGVRIEKDKLVEVLNSFVGTIQQVPPAYSAKKFKGYRYYQLARSGYSTSPSANTVRIDRITLRGVYSGEFPRIALEVECSRGTYMRALARDIGLSMGYPSTLSFLIRTYAFGFRIEDALVLEDLENSGSRAEKLDLIRRYLVPLEDALGHLSSVILKDNWIMRVKNGSNFTRRAALEVQENNNVLYRVMDKSGRLIAVARSEDGLRFDLERVF